MIKAIIFDWGGVLAPSDNKIAAESLGKTYSFDKDEFISEFQEHEDDLCHTNDYENFLSNVSKKFNIPEKEIIGALNATSVNENFSLARELAKQFRVYILSNQLKFRTDYIKSHNDLGFFDGVFFSNEIGLKKPSEEIFRFVLNKINLKPEECVFIDNTPSYIETAKRLGINTVLFKNPKQLKKELASFSININC